MHFSTLLPFVAILLFSCVSLPDRRVVATVDGEKIVAADLTKAFDEQSDMYDPELLRDPEGNFAVKKKVLNGLIEEMILAQTAREKKVSLTPDEETSLMAQLNSGYNTGEMERIARTRKISLSEWTDKQKRKRLIEKLIAKEVDAKIRLTDQEIEDYYKRYRPLFQEPDRIHCRHIVTSKRDKAETILRLLDKGENFAGVAQKYSESPDREKGGDLGFIARNEYPDVFIQACFSLAAGQTSQVVPSPYGFHIFRVVDKKPGGQLSLSQARNEIERRLREGKSHPALKAWIDELFRNKKITVDEKALKEVSLAINAPPPETQSSKTQRNGE